MIPRTMAGRAILWRLEESAAYWAAQADDAEDGGATPDIAEANRAWRDAYRELLAWLPGAVAQAEDEAAGIEEAPMA